MLSQQILAQEWAIYKYNGQSIFGLQFQQLSNEMEVRLKVFTLVDVNLHHKTFRKE